MAALPETNLRTTLKAVTGEEIHFLCNIGNAGDGLIHAGFHQLVRDLDLKVDSFYYPEKRQGQNLLIMGAGGFCKSTWAMVDPVRYYASRYRKVYILPASFETSFAPVAELLRTLPQNVTVFCRERISYEAVTKLVPNPGHVFLDHDLAFGFDASRWKKTGHGSINVFRTDAESRFKLFPLLNFDVSAIGREYHETLLLDVLSHFACIYTDRLHVAIAGALLDKEVHLFRNSYHKIQGIYDYSLHRFENVKLFDDIALRQLVQASRRGELVHGVRKTAFKMPGGRSLLRVLKQVTGRIPKAKKMAGPS